MPRKLRTTRLINTPEVAAAKVTLTRKYYGAQLYRKNRARFEDFIRRECNGNSALALRLAVAHFCTARLQPTRRLLPRTQAASGKESTRELLARLTEINREQAQLLARLAARQRTEIDDEIAELKT